MRTLIALAPVWLVVTIGACNEATKTDASSEDGITTTANAEETAAMTMPAAPVLDGLTMTRLDGTPEALSDAYAGKTLLIVNTASRCGLTPQYEGLEALYQAKRDEGLVVLGFPANDFMGQEPLSNTEIAEFCRANYGVSFPMFEKTTVKGDGTNELFARLARATEEPSWNFTKYLVTPDGAITRFGPRTAPDADELVGAIDAALDAG